MGRNKGNRRYRWCKEGIKVGRKYMKTYWNRKVRHSKHKYKGCGYKKVAAESAFNMIL